MNLNVSRRTQSIIAIAAVVLLLIGLLAWYILRPSQTGQTPTASTTPSGATSTQSAPSYTGGGVSTTAKPKTKDNISGYTVATSGKTERITSTIAGVSFTTSINSDIAVVGGVLTVRPAESAKNETVAMRKTTGGFPSDFTFIRKAVDGTQLTFDAVRNSSDSSDYNPGNNLNPGHIYKIGNRFVDDIPAVYLHITTTATDNAPAEDYYLLWVHTGIENWYIVRSAPGLTAVSQTALDTIIGSLSLIR